jgi:hypothetical protein
VIFVRLARVRRRWRELQATARSELLPVLEELRRRRKLTAERQELSRPHRFVWRWYRHPLTSAYRESRRLRRVRLERPAR